MASDSDVGTPILALKNHERPIKAIKANEGQRRPAKANKVQNSRNPEFYQYSMQNNQLMPMCHRKCSFLYKRKISVLYYDYAHFGKKAKTLSWLSTATELLAFLRSLNATL